MGSIIGRLGDFPQGSIKEVSIQGKPYAISNVDGLFFAIDGIGVYMLEAFLAMVI